MLVVFCVLFYFRGDWKCGSGKCGTDKI